MYSVLIALKGEILLDTSTIVKQYIPYIVGPKRDGMLFSGMIKLKFLKVCRIKSIKVLVFFLFIFRILTVIF